MANGGNGEGGFQRSPNTYSGDRGGPAEDEALLAELRAISMKSGRSRFAEGTTNDDDDGNGNGNGDADEIAEIAEIGGVVTRGGGDRTAPRSTAAADEGFRAVARNCDDELGGGEIAPLEKGNETPGIPDGSARHDGDRADDDIADAPSLERIDGLIIEGGGGVHATPPNTFTGDRGGDALDDDLLAELKAISVGSSGGNRFDGDGKGDDGTPSDDLGRECTEIGQISLPPTLGGSRGTNDKSDKKSRPLPPWKKKGAKKKSDADDDDMDIVVAVPHALVVANPIHVATFFKEEVESKGIATRDSSESGMAEKCTSFEEDLSKFSSVKELGIQSNFPKTFVGDRGGAAEDADLLAELRAISNKSSSSNRFDGDNDDSRSSFSRNDNYSSIGLSESDAFVTKKPTSTNSGNEKQTRPLPPWKKKNAKKKSMMDDRMNIAAETPSMSAPLNPFENVMIGECDVSEYDVSADTGDAHAVLMDNSKSLDEKKTADFFENNDACLLKTVPPWKQKDSKAKYLANDNADVVIAAPPAASEANNEVDDDEDFFPNTNSTDLVDDSLPPTNTFTGVRGGPADDVSDTENVASTLVTGPPLAASVNLPKTFKGDRGGNAEDEALLAELRAISMRSSSNRFAGDEGDVAESKIDIVTGSVSIKSVSGENTHNSIKSTEATKKSEETSRPPPPWKRIGAKKATVGNELDAIIAAPPAPAEDRGDTNNHQQHTITMGVNSNDTGGFQRPPINTYTGDRGGNAEDEALLAELRAISMRSSSYRFAGVEGDVAESKIDIVTGSVSIRSISGENDDVVAPSPRKSTESTKKAKMTSRTLPPWKRICAKKATVGNELDVVIAVPPAPVEDRRDTNFKQQHTMAMAGNCNDAGGFQRPPVNTYTGDRGGSAEDEALLAELRAISMKSSSNRFAGDEGDVAESKIDIVTVRSMSGENTHNSINSAEATKNSEETSRPLPPWKRIGAKKATVGNELDAIIAAPPAPAEDRGDSNSKQQHTITMGVNSNDTGGFQRPPINTYTGDRGGSAEDEALLAELRAISMKSSSNRFAGDVVEVSAIQTRVEGLDIDPKATSDPGEGISSANNCGPSSVSVLPSVPLGKLSSGQDGDSMAFGGMGPPLSNNQDEIVITLEDLDETLKSSNWQLRKGELG
jgi:cytoskeleton-associated protein 5